MPLGDLYPDDAQYVADSEWMIHADQQGWIALTKDKNLVRDHRATLQASSLRLFLLPNANLTGPEMAQRVDVNLDRIIKKCLKPGPFVYALLPQALEKRWPRDTP